MLDSKNSIDFLKSQSDIYNSGNSELHLACLNNNHEEIKRLIKNGANIESRNDMGQTPLHLACFALNKPAVVALVEAGADINAIDNNVDNALHICAAFGDVEIARFLIEIGCDMQHLDTYKCNLLHQCAVVNNLALLEHIIDKFDIESLDRFDNTALSVALYFGSIEVAVYLIEKGANLNCKNIYGISPQDLLNDIKEVA